jgi:hypothetical protein
MARVRAGLHRVLSGSFCMHGVDSFRRALSAQHSAVRYGDVLVWRVVPLRSCSPRGHGLLAVRHTEIEAFTRCPGHVQALCALFQGCTVAYRVAIWRCSARDQGTVPPQHPLL